MKTEALDKLKSDISNNVNLYDSDSRWIDQYFEEAGMSRYSFNTGIMVPDVELTIGDSKTDCENAIKIYEAFKGQLNPIQASDLRLWAYLAHNTYWDYMRKRWSIDTPSDEDEDDGNNKIVSRIGTRYFFEASKGKAFVRQGISRLYWSAYLTYDENNDDPYEMTKVFLSKQDIFVVTTERSLARNRTLLIEALRVLKETGDLKREDIRRFFLNLNQEGGVIVFDSLSKQDAYDLAQRTMASTLEEKSEKNIKEENIVLEPRKIILGSRVVIKRMDTKTQLPIVVGKSPFVTKPDLVGLKVGDKVKLRNNTWIIESVD